MPSDPPQPIDRRAFVKSAVAIGGASALSACLDAEANADAESGPEFPRGPADLATLPERQHAWNEFLVTDANGDTVLPRHQVLLSLSYTGSVPPTTDERETVENAFSTVERAFERGTGGEAGTTFNDGLLFMLGYAPRYFARFDALLPDDLDLPTPTAVLDELDEPTDRADSADALLTLNSDYGSIPLAIEEALFGDLESLNGVEMDATLGDVFSVVDRRTGVVGRGLPAEKLDHDGINDDAPLSMGYKSGYQDTNPAEDRVTIQEEPFAGGTTQLSSRLGIDLDAWYDLDADARVAQMFSTAHTTEEVGETGENLGGRSGVTEEMAEDLETEADDHGRVGHAQKVSRARDDDFDPQILRRSEGVGTAPDHDAGMNFNSIQRGMESFVEARKAMDDLGGADAHHSGIVDFLDVERRATYLIPPRSLRALPSPRPDRE